MPGYLLYQGSTMLRSVYFYYISLAYMLIYFTELNFGKHQYRAKNHNETHIAGAIAGALLGLVLKKRL